MHVVLFAEGSLFMCVLTVKLHSYVVIIHVLIINILSHENPFLSTHLELLTETEIASKSNPDFTLRAICVTLVQSSPVNKGTPTWFIYYQN